MITANISMKSISSKIVTMIINASVIQKKTRHILIMDMVKKTTPKQLANAILTLPINLTSQTVKLT